VTAYESVATCCNDSTARANASTEASEFSNMMDYLQLFVKTSLRQLIQLKEKYRTCSSLLAAGIYSRPIVRYMETIWVLHFLHIFLCHQVTIMNYWNHLEVHAL
jgi:hypothetical protein